ncbi:MAG: glycosyltransferase family 2 protein [Atribacterota bacterium]
MINLIVAVENDIDILDQFLRWYKLLGVERFIVNVINNNNFPIYDEIKNKCDKYNSVVIDRGRADHDFKIQHKFRTLAQKQYSSKDDWTFFADLDEFYDLESINQIVNRAEAHKCNTICGTFVDRFCKNNNKFNKFDPRESIFDQYPIESDFSKKILKVPQRRYVAVKGWILEGSICPRFQDGQYLNIIEGCSIHEEIVKINHFKWRKGVVEKMKKRLNKYENSEEHKYSYRQCKRFLEYINRL